jgi:3D-(3,5/4)-trihydroxycyclohexane-1,2-dione acylhydrolase (decyclizing)
MGYEIAAGLGIKMAAPDRDVYVLVGDGSYLMMAQEIVTAVQENVKLTILIVDNHGFSSIGGLSKAVGCEGYATEYRYRSDRTGLLDGDLLPVDLAQNAASLGAVTTKACTRDAIKTALQSARASDRTTAIVIPVDREQRVSGYESWWDVPVAEVSTLDTVQTARREYERARRAERDYLRAPRAHS